MFVILNEMDVYMDEKIKIYLCAFSMYILELERWRIINEGKKDI